MSGQQGLVHNNAILVQSEKEIRIWIRRTVVKFTRSVKEKISKDQISSEFRFTAIPFVLS